jgi:hypothetical protein
MVSGSVTGVAVCRFESCPDYHQVYELKIKIMKELKIYEFQAKQIEDTFRLVARTLDSKTKTTSVDRDVMQSWEMIKNVLAEKIDTHVPRF